MVTLLIVLPTVAFMVCNSLPTEETSTTTFAPPTCKDKLTVRLTPTCTIWFSVFVVANPALATVMTVGARGNVGEEVAPGRVRIRSARDIGCDIGQRNRGARHHRIRLVSH